MDHEVDNNQEEQKYVYTDPNADVKVDKESEKSSFIYKSPDIDHYESTGSSDSGTQTAYQYQEQRYQADRNPYSYQNQPGYEKQAGREDASVLSMGDWILTLIPTLIPCGFVFYIYWAFAGNVNVNRRNFSRAYLVIIAASLVIGLLIALFCSVWLVGIASAVGSAMY